MVQAFGLKEGGVACIFVGPIRMHCRKAAIGSDPLTGWIYEPTRLLAAWAPAHTSLLFNST